MNHGGGMSMEEMALNCSGAEIPERQGNWLGHVFPGSLFILWGSNWLIGIFMRYFESRRSNASQPYTCQSTEHILPFIPVMKRASMRVPIESVLKAIFGFLLFFVQVFYGGYKYIVCPANAPRGGRVASHHVNSWAHGAMNLGFMTSGIVELMGLVQELPHGVTQGFLSLAFFVEYLLMGLHEKHGSLDSLIHKLLTYSMLAGSFFAGLECVWTRSMPLSAARAASMILQGTWFLQAASILFGGHVFWEDKYSYMMGGSLMPTSDMGPAMALPVVFVMHIVCITLCVVFVYALVGYLSDPRRHYGHHLGAPTGHGHGHALSHATANGGYASFALAEQAGLLSDGGAHDDDAHGQGEGASGRLHHNAHMGHAAGLHLGLSGGHGLRAHGHGGEKSVAMQPLPVSTRH